MYVIHLWILSLGQYAVNFEGHFPVSPGAWRYMLRLKPLSQIPPVSMTSNGMAAAGLGDRRSHSIDSHGTDLFSWNIPVSVLLNINIFNRMKKYIWPQVTSYLTRSLVTSYGDIDLDQHWLRLWLGTWCHQAITCTNYNLSPICFVAST